MNKEIKRKYLAKAKDSFKTKKNIYFFYLAIESEKHDDILADFKKFKIEENEDLVNKYTTEYWQYKLDEKITGTTNKSVREIEFLIKHLDANYKNEIVKMREDYVENFYKIFPLDDFEKLIDKDCCEYCGITVTDVERLVEKHQLYKKSLRGWTLEIDRKNSNYEYTKDNCVMACYWCNNAKTDEFTYEEFKIIGKGIKKVWGSRLKK